MSEELYDLLEIFLLLEALLQVLHASLSQYNVSVYCEDLTHGYLVFFQGAFLAQKGLKGSLPLPLEVGVALEAGANHGLELFKHGYDLLDELRLRQDLLDLGVLFVLLLREVYARDQLRPLLKNVIAEGLSDRLKVLLLLVQVKGIEQAQVVHQVMREQELDAGVSLQKSLLVVEKHLRFELFQDTVLYIIPGQVTIDSALLFLKVLVGFLKILRQAD